MPNWAFGDVEVTGTKAGVTSFCERFIFPDGPRITPGKRILGRSFHDDHRTHIMSSIDAEFKGKLDDAVSTVTLSISFAWSADSCLISRYPVIDPLGCISLSDACKEDQVSVHIHTYLFDEGTEEDIVCDAEGKLEQDTMDMVRAKCPHCGNEQSVVTTEDLKEATCSECGETGLHVCTEEDE